MSGKSRRSRRQVGRAINEKKIPKVLLLVVLVNLFIMLGWLVWQISGSKVLGVGRFNFVVMNEDGYVGLASVDKVERSIRLLELPSNLSIQSRSVGQYQVDKLYELAKYEDERGDFVRRKIQGFLRVPVQGYLVLSGSENDSLRRIREGLLASIFGKLKSDFNSLDSTILFFRTYGYVWYRDGEEDLVRDGVLISRDGWGGYNEARLMAYVKQSFFDWEVAGEGIKVSIVDESGEEALGGDVSDFVSNMGASVVMVRGGSYLNGRGKIIVNNKELIKSKTVDNLSILFGINDVEIGDTNEYRADVVIYVGEDMGIIF